MKNKNFVILYQKEIKKIVSDYIKMNFKKDVSKFTIKIKPNFKDDGTESKALDKFDCIICEII